MVTVTGKGPYPTYPNFLGYDSMLFVAVVFFLGCFVVFERTNTVRSTCPIGFSSFYLAKDPIWHLGFHVGKYTIRFRLDNIYLHGTLNVVGSLAKKKPYDTGYSTQQLGYTQHTFHPRCTGHTGVVQPFLLDQVGENPGNPWLVTYTTSALGIVFVDVFFTYKITWQINFKEIFWTTENGVKLRLDPKSSVVSVKQLVWTFDMFPTIKHQDIWATVSFRECIFCWNYPSHPATKPTITTQQPFH